MRQGVWSGGLLVLAVIAAGCGSSNSAQSSSTTSQGTVPSATQRVYPATALACSFLKSDQAEGVTFTPLAVRGRTFSTTLDPADDCRQQRIFNSYVYEVPTPKSGVVRITPGNQPTAILDAMKLTRSGAATVFYGRVGEGRYRVTVIKYSKYEEVKDAP